MGRPSNDATAFVATVQVAINSYDLEAIAGLYADDAILEATVDGTEERFHGADAIRAAWSGYLDEMRSAGVSLDKKLESASGDTIVSSHESSFEDGRTGHGIETWRFDADGRVREHHLYSFQGHAPKLAQQLRLLMTYPRMAIALLRSARR
jgi:ketosteroid isomerase-like protein